MRKLRGHGSCACQDLDLDPYICEEIQEIIKFQAEFIPDKGGDWGVLKKRPMSAKLKQYCIVDIRYMAPLFRKYGQSLRKPKKDSVEEYESSSANKDSMGSAIRVPADMLNDPPGYWVQQVVEKSKERVLQSWGDGWDRNAPQWHMTISPWAIPTM